MRLHRAVMLTGMGTSTLVGIMNLPSIRFEDIRPLDGSQNAGFEEICVQLAALSTSPGAAFVRKGRGGDGGVECFARNLDGSEIGWQTKYVFAWDSGLVAQLDESMKAALAKHAHLTDYVVCLPFDLPDARRSRAKSARQKWEEWRARWTSVAELQGRVLSIRLWGRSELIARLTQDTERTGGRILYWFGAETFTPAWFREHFERTRAALGSRYTPATNVDLPIRQDFLGLTRDPILQEEVDAWFIRIAELGRSAIRAIGELATTEAASNATALGEAIRSITSALGCDPVSCDQNYPVEEWKARVKRGSRLASTLAGWLYTLPAQNGTSNSGSDPISRAQHDIRRLHEGLYDVEDALVARRWRLANARVVLLTGEAGAGKSHLLADIVEHAVLSRRPAVMLLGSSFRDDEPWRQILAELDRPATEQVRHFLGALDAAAEAADTRAIVCIDALNERNGVDIWPHRLAAFLKVADAFPRVTVVLSCRTTYLPYVVPGDLDSYSMLRVDHEGFADDTGSAAKAYLDKREIVRPGAPNLVPEFNNPLFLKTCCDLLEREGSKEFPRGLRGISSIYEFYNAAVARAVNQRLGLDPSYGLVPRSISGFAEIIAASRQGYLELGAAIAFFETIYPSRGERAKSLLSQLVAEGLLSIEPIPGDAGALTEYVRFTFERFSDHAIAKSLLDECLLDDDVIGSFAAGSKLANFVGGQGSYRCAGAIEAIAIQLPERTGVELPDVAEGPDWLLRDAFLASLLWREQSKFTDRTMEVLRSLVSQDRVNDIVISVSTEPNNKFNARYVHSRLIDRSLAERDAFWSTYLVRKGLSGEVETIVSWALTSEGSHLDDERALLSGLMLTWFFTTPHRPVRDRSTKALTSLLSQRLWLGAKLLHEFQAVNDNYVTERLLAACYGAALQGSGVGLSKLAEAVFDIIFRSGQPIIDALARDHANGIIELAHSRGVLPAAIDLDLCRPPYRSPWPIELVPDDVIESYVETSQRGTFRDAIVGSTVNDGDFARYKIDYKVRHWSPASIGSEHLPNAGDIYSEWLAEFLASATTRQRVAFESLVEAADAAAGKREHENGPEIVRWKAARTSFRRTISARKWEDYRVRAEDFLRYLQAHGRWQDRQATFSARWARRWICKRAHDLGWRPELFGEFERIHNRTYDRNNHRVERIGKKYQWIALRELIARMADNLAFVHDQQDGDADDYTYSYARRVGLRDIDPSLLTPGTFSDGWRQWPRTWWVPVQLTLRPTTSADRLAWLKSDDDIITGESLIDVTDGRTGKRWLVLSTFGHWRGYGLRGGQKEYQRESWFRLRCLVARKGDLKSLVSAFKNRSLIDPHSLDRIELSSEFYLGEYPWHPGLKGIDEWTSSTSWRAPPKPVRPTTAEYSRETGGYDFSIDRHVSVEVPAPWLASELNLHLADGRFPVYKNLSGDTVFLDPSIYEPGPAAALVDRDVFFRMLEERGLAALWIIAGEKGAYGGPDPGRGFGGRYEHTTLFWWDSAWARTQTHGEWSRPSEEQLLEFFAEEA